jgi:hypothetical protein
MEKIEKGAQTYLLHCCSIEAFSNEIDVPKGLDEILGKHNTIFQDLPHGLPRAQLRNNVIELIPSLARIRKKLVMESKCILEVKTKIFCSRSVNEYLIKWRNLPEDKATKENEELRLKYPSLPMLCG